MSNIKKLTLAGLFCALAVAGSFISIPVLGSRCAPVQHMVNVIAAIILGPWIGLAIAFCSSLLRNMMGIGSILAFPGSMFGVFIAGVLYRNTKSILTACIGEAFGTGIIGGLCAYPIAVLFMGKNAAELGYFVYVTPFLISTVVGSTIGGLVVFSLAKSKALNWGSV
ncbi:energy coupling factor transporter S component ThiW [Peptostreptococcus russellii]|uniref:energy coupling factor transporter S component ThiW n=1 Tax=Peptostreptococcus russellii TaxID=215200 RepID=UPI00294394FC|nr:energy coupling factor transporter S component ThiW [Peptostreptococcus russellii]